jgi:hypothetical protein
MTMALWLGVLVALWMRRMPDSEESARESLKDALERVLALSGALQRTIDDVTRDFRVQDHLVEGFSSLDEVVRKMAKDVNFLFTGFSKARLANLEKLNELACSVADVEELVAPVVGKFEALTAHIDEFGTKLGENDARRRQVNQRTAHTVARLHRLDEKVVRLDARAAARAKELTAQLAGRDACLVATFSEQLNERDALWEVKFNERSARIEALLEARFAQIHGQTQVEEVMGREEAEDVPKVDRLESARPPSDAPAAAPPVEEPSQMEGPLEPTVEEASEEGGEPTQGLAAAVEGSDRSSETAVTQDPAPAVGDLTPAPDTTEEEQPVESAPADPVASEEERSLEAVSESEPVSVAEDAGAPESAPGTMGQSGTVPTSSPPVEHLDQVCFSDPLLTFD